MVDNKENNMKVPKTKYKLPIEYKKYIVEITRGIIRIYFQNRVIKIQTDKMYREINKIKNK